MRRLRISLCLGFLLCSTYAALAAEYLGRDVDGQLYNATAYSYGTSKYYDVTVEFSGDEAIIYFQRGGHITLTLDDDEIDDPHNIYAFDYAHAVYWDLDVGDL